MIHAKCQISRKIDGRVSELNEALARDEGSRALYFPQLPRVDIRLINQTSNMRIHNVIMVRRYPQQQSPEEPLASPC